MLDPHDRTNAPPYPVYAECDASSSVSVTTWSRTSSVWSAEGRSSQPFNVISVRTEDSKSSRMPARRTAAWESMSDSMSSPLSDTVPTATMRRASPQTARTVRDRVNSIMGRSRHRTGRPVPCTSVPHHKPPTGRRCR